MFHFFKKKPTGQVITLRLGGMHCTSCAMNIDGALEDTQGVIRATTNYAKAVVTIEYDPKQTRLQKLKSVIKDQGYTVVE